MFLLEQSHRRKLLGTLATSGVCSMCLLLICKHWVKTITPLLLGPRALPGKERAEAAFFVVEVFVFNVSLNSCRFGEALFSSLGKSYFEKSRLTLLSSRWANAGKNR